MNSDLKYALTLLAGVGIAGLMTGLVVAALKKSRGPSNVPGVWVYSVAPNGPTYASSIAPDQGENWSWKFIGRSFTSAEEARAAAIAEIEKQGGVPKEFVT